MRIRGRQRLLKRLAAIRTLQQERAGAILAEATREQERADADCAAAAARLHSAQLEWDHLQAGSSLDLEMARTSARWLVLRDAELGESQRVGEAFREEAEHRRSALMTALGKREIAVALEKDAARIGRRHIDEAALAAAEERATRKVRP